jgi:hypothetical protein
MAMTDKEKENSFANELQEVFTANNRLTGSTFTELLPTRHKDKKDPKNYDQSVSTISKYSWNFFVKCLQHFLHHNCAIGSKSTEFSSSIPQLAY